MTGSRIPAPELADLEALYDAHHRQAIGAPHRLLHLPQLGEVLEEDHLAGGMAACVRVGGLILGCRLDGG